MVIHLFAPPFKEAIKYTRDLHSMETIRSGIIFTYTTYIVFGVVPFLFVSIWFWEICNIALQVPRLGVGWTVYFHKGGWVNLQE